MAESDPSIKYRLEQIAETFHVADIYVFGSRAQEIASRLSTEGRPLEEDVSSDVDIGVRPRNGAYLNVRMRVELMAALEDLFQVGRVDLVVLPDVDPFLALEAVQGELIYTKDLDDQARYELFVLRRAGDLLPYKRERIRMILEEGAL
ncbi:MAG: hypothetical protein JRJ01_13860 [Deltaproteobacteria bacterium]|nr:hypothetical protein [Deltaproteobacteria bacterium]